MNFTSPIFFAFVFATVLAFHLSSNLSYRRVILSIASLTLVASYSTTWLQLLPLTIRLQWPS